MCVVFDFPIRWVDSLKKHALTTQLIIIGNVRAFLKFLVEAELPEVKAPRKRIQGALFTLQSMAKMSRKDLQSHRQSIRLKKSSRFHKSLLWLFVLFSLCAFSLSFSAGISCSRAAWWSWQNPQVKNVKQFSECFSGMLVSPAHIARFLRKAKKKIPAALCMYVGRHLYKIH